MDDSQKILSTLLDTVPGCINSRQKLKSSLMDILPSKKLEINLILNAYDEDVIEKLNDSSDATLRALQLIKTLSDDYGLTTESSKWAVISWCYILGYDDIATALDIISVGGNLQRVTPAPGKTHIIGIGTYKAGFDFQSGDIKLKHLTKDLQAPGYKEGVNILHGRTIDCYINSSQGSKGAKKICSFIDSCHLEVNEGEYLIIKTDFNLDSCYIKIELIEYNI